MRFVFVAVSLLVGAGCRTGFALKTYAATSVVREGIRGRTVAVVPFVDERQEAWASSQPLADPVGFMLTPLTPEELERWEADCDRLDAAVPAERQSKVGQRYNAYRQPTFEIYSTTGPAPWLTEATELELKAQGAELVEPANADVVIEGVVRHAFLQVHAVMWVNLVLDVTYSVRGLPPRTVRIHTRDQRNIELAATHLELLQVFMAAEQKLEQALVDELSVQLTVDAQR